MKLFAGTLLVNGWTEQTLVFTIVIAYENNAK